MKYLDTKGKSLEDSVISVLETNKNNRSDDGEGLDAVQPDAVKKKFKDRKDKDIDNDGDVDDSDKFLHKKRKAISKAMKKEGTWHLPDSSKEKAGLKKLMQKPIKLGKEGDDATDAVSQFIGDDALFDAIHDAGNKNPNGDARPIIKKHLKRLGIKEDVELDEGYESEVLKVLKDADIEGYFKMGKLYVSRRDAKDAKKALEDSDEITKLPKMVMEDVELDENYRKLAMKGIGTETKKGARVGLKTDYYLPKNGDKSFGKITRVSKDGYEIEDEKTKKTYKFKFYDSMNDPTSVRGTRKENYDIGNDYAKHTLEVTPGQDKSDVDEMLGIMQKKSVSMREALAKVWGVDEGKSPFQKKEEKIKEKTLTGKKPTEVKVDPEIEVK